MNYYFLDWITFSRGKLKLKIVLLKSKLLRVNFQWGSLVMESPGTIAFFLKVTIFKWGCTFPS